MSAIIFDTETTGVTEEDRIVQAASIKPIPLEDASPRILFSMEHPCILENEFFQPPVPIQPGAMGVHHIVESDLNGCRKSEEFELPADTTYIIGHNIDFDWKMIGKPDVKRICTLALSRSLWPGLDTHNQSAMLYYLYGEELRDQIKGAHDALADCRLNQYLLLKILMELEAKHDMIITIEMLWELSEEARIPTHWQFGKFKGQLIQSADRGYIGWYRRLPDACEYVLEAISRHF